MCQLFVAVPLLATPCQDINAHSQRWMLQGTGSDCCVFPDVLGFFEGLGNTRQLLAADYMQKFHVVSRAEYKGSSVCLRHGGRAHRSHESGQWQWASPECAIPAVDLDVAGLPCTDFSSAGLRMAEQGPTILVHLAWARKMLHEQPALILHENVPLYPAQLLQQHLGAIYNLYTFLVSPSDAGFTLQSRRRQHTMLVHKTKAILTHDPYETYAMLRATLQRTTTSPANALLATPDDVRAEAMHICAGRGLQPPQTGTDSLEYLLNARELGALRLYSAMWRSRFGTVPEEVPWCLFFLGDNPSKRATWSANTSMPSQRLNGGLLWSPRLRRMVTGKERLAAMGFPSFPRLAAAAGVPELDALSPAEATRACGNAMHVASVGLMLLVLLSCTSPRLEQPPPWGIVDPSAQARDMKHIIVIGATCSGAVAGCMCSACSAQRFHDSICQ